VTSPSPSVLDVGHPVRRAVARWLATFAADGPLLVAVSGGADSLALAAAVIAAAPGRDPVAATVDHRLQGGSADQAARCADQLRAMGFRRTEILGVDVGGAGGPEAAARDARYRALLAAAGAVGERCPVLLGHTLDDQAETVLLGLGRGSGPRSIAGMRPWRPPWGRPLLGVRRRDTENACAATRLSVWEDPHNSDPAFTRVRLRAEVLPLLEDVLGGGVAPALARTADLLSDDLDAIDSLSEQAMASALAPDGSLGCLVLAGSPPALRRRALRRWLAGQDVSRLTADHLFRLDRLLEANDGAAVRVHGGADVIRRAGRLHIDHRQR